MPHNLSRSFGSDLLSSLKRPHYAYQTNDNKGSANYFWTVLILEVITWFGIRNLKTTCIFPSSPVQCNRKSLLQENVSLYRCCPKINKFASEHCWWGRKNGVDRGLSYRFSKDSFFHVMILSRTLNLNIYFYLKATFFLPNVLRPS